MALGNISIEGCRIIFRNLAGAPDKFNPTGGVRTITVAIPNEMAPQLEEEGWNIKWLKPISEYDEPQASLKVKAAYGKNPPKIYICTSRNKELCTADTVGAIDYAEIENVDIVIRPYCYENIAGKSGVSAYIKTMYVTIAEDPFSAKYEYDTED